MIQPLPNTSLVQSFAPTFGVRSAAPEHHEAQSSEVAERTSTICAGPAEVTLALLLVFQFGYFFAQFPLRTP